MPSYLKAMCLAFVFALAIIATPTAAMAVKGEFTAEKYPAEIHANSEQEIGGEDEYFELAGNKIECASSDFSGSLGKASSQLTIAPDYTDHTQAGNCRTAESLSTTITENGCAYVFHVNEKGGGGEYNGTVDIECPAGKTIVLHVRDLINSKNICTITVPAQEGLEEVVFTNNAGHIDLTGIVAGLKATVHSQSSLCGVPSGESKEIEGKYRIKSPITYTSEGSQIAVSDPPPPPTLGYFKSNEYPATVAFTAEQELGKASYYFEGIGRKIECEKVHYATSYKAVVGDNTALTLAFDYTDHTQEGTCTATKGLAVTLTENGCDYLFNDVTKAGEADFSVGMTLECPPGTVLVVDIRNSINSALVCTMTLLPQKFGGSLTAESNEGHIDLSGTVTFIAITHSFSTLFCGIPNGTSQESTLNFVFNKPLSVSATPAELSLSE